MKKFLLIPIFLVSFAYGQSLPISQVSFGTRADLKLQIGMNNTQVFLNGLLSLNDGNGGTYMWSSTSTATDDGFTVISVTNVGTGRWLRLQNSNTIKLDYTLSGVALQTAYNVSFGITLPAPPAMIIPSAYSQGAAFNCWITNVTATGCTLNFNNALNIGTNNIVGKLLIIKQ